MGTNFYWITDDWCTWSAESEEYKSEHSWDRMEPAYIHIGKRSAAGLYCWDCGVTFCAEGSGCVHMSKDPYHGNEIQWHTACPCCGKEPDKSPLTRSTAGVELGFAKSKDVERHGVGSCSSFTWTKMEHKRKLKKLLRSKKKVVRDEYDREYTAREFLEEELAAVVVERQYYGCFC